MEKLMIWCTCAEDNKVIYLKKVSKWYKQVKSIFSNLDPDYYCFVDGEVTEEDKINIDKDLLNLNFVNLLPKLGRTSIIKFQGWKRSFKTALEYGRNYDYLIHIENDVKILNTKNILEYATKPGYYLGHCKTYGFVETAFIILNNKELNQKFIEHFPNNQSFYQNDVFEFTFQHIAKDKYQLVFETDRIEGHSEKINANYDYVCQFNVLQDNDYKENKK